MGIWLDCFEIAMKYKESAEIEGEIDGGEWEKIERMKKVQLNWIEYLFCVLS